MFAFVVFWWCYFTLIFVIVYIYSSLVLDIRIIKLVDLDWWLYVVLVLSVWLFWWLLLFWLVCFRCFLRWGWFLLRTALLRFVVWLPVCVCVCLGLSFGWTDLTVCLLWTCVCLFLLIQWLGFLVFVCVAGWFRWLTLSVCRVGYLLVGICRFCFCLRIWLFICLFPCWLVVGCLMLVLVWLYLLGCWCLCFGLSFAWLICWRVVLLIYLRLLAGWFGLECAVTCVMGWWGWVCCFSISFVRGCCLLV